MATRAEQTVADPARPHFGVFSQFIDRQIDVSGKKMSEIAFEVGFARPNMVSMIRGGYSKLPVNKVKKMAISLGVDPAFLMRLMLQEYEPETLAIIEDVFGRKMLGGALAEAMSILAKSPIADQTALKAEQVAALQEVSKLL
jgi:hypothetical protein